MDEGLVLRSVCTNKRQQNAENTDSFLPTAKFETVIPRFLCQLDHTHTVIGQNIFHFPLR